MTTIYRSTFLVLVAGLLNSSPAGAAEDPDWPCVQRLVPELSPAMMWAGPALDQVEGSWRGEPVVAELAPELAARRVPLEEANTQVADLAASLEPASRERTLTLLFAGIFEIIGRERQEIIAGIKRFNAVQERLAESVRSANAELRQLAGGSSAQDQMRRQAISERRDWEVRLFDERRDALTYLCEQPVLLEQRAFQLARAIAGELE
ncbi:MAG: hypothetical protein R3349_03200 [Geminicoccaceae bacterium]|nr:hypothetical protein [Geminicoccaceae bacterium]